MPRGVRKILTAEEIQEQVAQLDSKIEKYQKNIVALKAKKKALIESKESAAFDVLFDEIKKSGKSPDEILLFLKNQ